MANVLTSTGNYTSGVIFITTKKVLTCVATININHGWWVDMIQIVCPDDHTGVWRGGENMEGINESSVDVERGLVSLSTNFNSNNDHSFPSLFTFFECGGEEEGESSHRGANVYQNNRVWNQLSITCG